MKRLILLRHGLIDYCTQRLNGDGQKFAAGLPALLKLSSLDCVCSDRSDRCVDTVQRLAKKFSLEVQTFCKAEFVACIPLQHCLNHGTSVLCYRIEAINPILRCLGLCEFTEETRDIAYELALDVSFDEEGRVSDCSKILTGYSKSKSP